MNLWIAEEDTIVNKYFHSIPFSSHGGSRFDIIQKELKEAGFDRTTKSISRRSYRLGLRSTQVNNPKILVVCTFCGKEYYKPQKYVIRDKRQRCTICQKKNGGYVDLETKKAWQKKYHQTWKKKGDGKNE